MKNRAKKKRDQKKKKIKKTASDEKVGIKLITTNNF